MLRRMLLVFGTTLVASCASMGTRPSAPISEPIVGAVVDDGSPWQIYDLGPAEQMWLNDDSEQAFSASIAISSRPNQSSSYEVVLISNRRELHPFRVALTAGVSQFNAKITWFTRVYGPIQEIRMNLYDIKVSPSRKTTERTLLKQISREYQVACNPTEFAFVRAIRRSLGWCQVHSNPA